MYLAEVRQVAKLEIALEHFFWPEKGYLINQNLTEILHVRHMTFINKGLRCSKIIQ